MAKKQNSVFKKQPPKDILFEFLKANSSVSNQVSSTKNIIRKSCVSIKDTDSINSSVSSLSVSDNVRFTWNKSSFKKSLLNDSLAILCEALRPFYYLSKQHYIDKKHNYKSVTTIVRQLCKVFELKYLTTMNYIKSTYEIVYTIEWNGL